MAGLKFFGEEVELAAIGQLHLHRAILEGLPGGEGREGVSVRRGLLGQL